MRGLLVVAALAAFAVTSASADQYVHGYTRKDGTVVQPYYRNEPDSTRSNNYSTYPNVNPYTGQVGTHHVDPSSSYSQPRPAYDPYGSSYQQPKPSLQQDPYGSSYSSGDPQ